MSNLKITINPYRGTNDASVNGILLSPYSELSDYLQQPVLHWADKLSKIVERQINDHYELTLVGEAFDVLFFEALLTGEGSLCRRYTGEGFPFSSLPKRFAGIEKLVQKYGCNVQIVDFKITAYSDCFCFDEQPLVQTVAKENAFLIIIRDVFSLASVPSANVPRLVIIPGKDTSIQYQGNGSYLWQINEAQLEKVLDAIVDRFSKIPYVVAAAKELFKNNALTDYDRQFLSLILSVDALISVDKIGRMEVGTSTKLSVKAIPENAPLPEVRVLSKNPDILNVNGLNLCAVAPGSACIEVFKGNDFSPVYRQQVEVFQDKKVRRIILDRSEPNMGIGRSQKITLDVEPADAEDKDFIVWSSDNPSVAVVDNSGVVTAKGPGRAVLTASTSAVKESVIVDVLPNIQQMIASVTDITLSKGDSAPICVSCAPAKCFDNNCSWNTSNSDVAYVETYIDGTSAIIAKDIGECILTCVANEGGCSVSCHVEVLDPVVEENKRKANIDLACLIGIPLAIVVFLIIISTLFG